VTTAITAASSPAAKLPSCPPRLTEGAVEPTAMCQYPAAELWTEL
jgi:hypothetical protein